mgnify:CR=1 FL=1
MNAKLILVLIQLILVNSQDIRTIIVNGLLVTGKQDVSPFLGHILIGENGKIVNVIRETGFELNELKEKYQNAEIIDAKDKIVIPGGVDAGVRLDFLEGKNNVESSDNIFTGSVAAVCGGTTTIVDLIEPDLNEREKPVEALGYKFDDAEHSSVIDYSFHMALNYISKVKMNIDKSIKKTIYKYGVNSFKLVTITQKEKLNDQEILHVFNLLKKYGGLAVVSCENEEIINSKIAEVSDEDKYMPMFYAKTHTPESERDEIEHIINIAKQVGFTQGIHINHISTEMAAHLIKKEKMNGFIVTTEVTPHHLILTEELYEGKNGIDYITSPPLRTKKDIERLWRGINEGTIEYVVSDHCPFTKEQKRGKRTKPDYRIFYNDDMSINKTYDTTYEKWSKNPKFYDVPQGLAGIETRMILMYHYGVHEKRINLEKYVEITSTNAAKRLGLYPRKGLLERGSDADIVIIDPNETTILKAEKLHMNTNFCPFEDLTLNGRIKTVFSRGAKMVDNYVLLGSALKHKGNMLRRMRYFLGVI